MPPVWRSMYAGLLNDIWQLRIDGVLDAVPIEQMPVELVQTVRDVHLRRRSRARRAGFQAGVPGVARPEHLAPPVASLDPAVQRPLGAVVLEPVAVCAVGTAARWLSVTGGRLASTVRAAIR
jgi:hypothetical protein